MKKILVFYRGCAPDGTRTNWVIHKYRATDVTHGTYPGQVGISFRAFLFCLDISNYIVMLSWYMGC